MKFMFGALVALLVSLVVLAGTIAGFLSGLMLGLKLFSDDSDEETRIEEVPVT